MVHAFAHRLRKGMNLGLAEAGFRIESFIAPLLETARRQGVARLQTGLKGEAIMRQGDAADTVFILETGLVKLVYSTAAGDEWIKSFIVDRGIFGSVDTGDLEEPSRFGAQCIEASGCVRLPLAWARRAIAADAGLTSAYFAYSAWLQRRKEAREEMLLCQSPEQSYRNFLLQNEELAGRLPQGDIARYLGITPVAFSRIKRRMNVSPTLVSPLPVNQK